MPGSPATSPRLAIPRFSNADTADFATDANSLIDAIDVAAAGFASGTDAGKGAAASSNAGKLYRATDSGALYYSDGSAWRTVFGSRGAVSIAGTESRTNTAYGTLATPDQVTGIVLPTNGMIVVGYQATWKESVLGAASAAIFLGATQLRYADATGPAPIPQSASIYQQSTAFVNHLTPLTSSPGGLTSALTNNADYSGDVSTGQIIGMFPWGDAAPSVTAGGPLHTFAAAGTYTVSVQFKATSGSVTALNRKLWVQALSFG